MHHDPHYDSVIPASVRYDDSLSNAAKLLYGELSSLAIRDGYCWTSNHYLAQRFKVSNRAISKWVAHLHHAGHVKVEVRSRNKRKIWITHPGKFTSPPANNRSRGIERLFVGDRTKVLHSIKDHIKEDKYTQKPWVCVDQFLDLWCLAYQEVFKVAYKRQGTKDQQAAQELLRLEGYTSEQLIELARKAWGCLDKFNSKHSVSLSSFTRRFNEIRAEVGALHKPKRERTF